MTKRLINEFMNKSVNVPCLLRSELQTQERIKLLILLTSDASYILISMFKSCTVILRGKSDDHLNNLPHKKN